VNRITSAPRSTAWRLSRPAASVPRVKSVGRGNTFATDFIAGGGSVEDTMAVACWKARHMLGHYNLGNVDARSAAAQPHPQACPTALRDTAKQRATRSRAAAS
jgi:hypothetical protein